MHVFNAPFSPPPAKPPMGNDAALRRAADNLEATFVSEMLKSAGVGKTSEHFGGGAGEEQFASFLRQAQADAIVAKGGFGLAEHIFESLKAKNNAET